MRSLMKCYAGFVKQSDVLLDGNGMICITYLWIMPYITLSVCKEPRQFAVNCRGCEESDELVAILTYSIVH